MNPLIFLLVVLWGKIFNLLYQFYHWNLFCYNILFFIVGKNWLHYQQGPHGTKRCQAPPQEEVCFEYILTLLYDRIFPVPCICVSFENKWQGPALGAYPKSHKSNPFVVRKS